MQRRHDQYVGRSGQAAERIVPLHQIVQMSATVTDLVNAAAIAAHDALTD
jgi:hypothetical protein